MRDRKTEILGVGGAPRAALLLLAAIAAAGAPSVVRAKSILVIAPHPDDEMLIAAGRMRSGVRAGDVVKVAIVTNGDVNGVASGLQREGESVAAAQVVGLVEQDVIFLGYGDGALNAMYEASPDTVIASQAGQTSTYATRGLGGMDYHRFIRGVSGPYTRATLLEDLTALVTNYRPDEIYTVSAFEAHPDHAATSRFVAEALVALERGGSAPSTKLFEGFVYQPNFYSCGEANWPGGAARVVAPSLPLDEPPCMAQIQQEWSRVTRFPVPPDMQTADLTANLKYQAILKYASQNPTAWLVTFVRKDEVFFLHDLSTNLAPRAQVSASSENPWGGAAANATNEVVDLDDEWVASGGELAGSWIELDWAAPVRVSRVNLFDRPSTTDDVLAGTLLFSDGTSVPVGPLPPDGKVLEVAFAPRTVTSVQFRVDQAAGFATGLSELQVLGVPAASTANVPPAFSSGPAPARTINENQTSALASSSYDLDGDPVAVQWSADGGVVQDLGGGAAVFTPPAVTTETVYTVTARLSDGRGGAASNSTFVTVVPGVNALTVAPASVVAGSGAQGTVTLAIPAPAGGTVVPLASDAPTLATVPASITVPAGAITARFNVRTAATTAPVTVTLSATIAGAAYTAPLVVAPATAPGNLARIPGVTVTVSSETASTGQLGVKAVDGVADGYPGDYTREWAALDELAGAWIQLTWSAPVTVQQVNLYDRPNGGDNVQAGTLLFSDGSAAAVGTLPNGGGRYAATFAVRTVSWLRFRVDQAVGSNIGLAELEVFGPSAADGVSVTPATIASGDAAQGNVTLASPAPAGGLTIPLTSSDPLSAVVPASVTVPAAASTASFPVSTGMTATSTTVTISAAFPAGTQATTVTVLPPPVVMGVALTPSTVTAGQGSLGSVTLRNPAGPQGAVVTLSSSAPGSATVPSTVTVPSGAFSATFPATTSASASGAVDVTASTATSAATATLQITPVAVTGVSVVPATVTGGTSAQGTVTISASAPTGGVVVALVSSNAGAAGVPASVTVAAGATSATFPVTTSPVGAITPVTVTASVGGSTRTANVTVAPPSVSGLSLSPTTVVGGASSTGTVTLNGAAPAGGLPIALSSDSASAAVPASVVAAAGATSVTFTVGTSPVSATTPVTVSATAGGATRTATLNVSAPALSAVSVSPTSVVGGTASTGTVTLNGAAPASGVAVALSDASSAASVPATVTVAAGSTTATFPIATVPVDVNTTAAVSATLRGTTRSANLTVARATLASLALAPTIVAGGSTSTGTATLNGPAGPSGVVVTLSDNSTAATEPGAITIPAGATSGTFTIATTTVTVTTSVTVSAIGNGVTRTAALSVRVPALSTLSVSPTTVVGGTVATGTVTLTVAAPPGGVVVTLTSSRTTAATVPVDVTVPAGSTTAAFPVTTYQVTASTSSTISATSGGVTLRVTLSVTP